MNALSTPTKIIEDTKELYSAQLKSVLEDKVFGEAYIDGVKYPTVPPQDKDKILSSENMKKYFIPAFTDESIDYEQNYETLETMGDLWANTFIGEKIIRKWPNITPSELSNMLAYYKSNREFASNIISTIPSINRLIRIRDKDNIPSKVYADIFEALIYAVKAACNSVSPGIGRAW